MTDEFGEEGSEYPLTLTGTNFRRFKPSLGEFITQLVRQCAQAELLYDEFMMDYVLQVFMQDFDEFFNITKRNLYNIISKPLLFSCYPKCRLVT